jgi:hypothetical protein
LVRQWQGVLPHRAAHTDGTILTDGLKIETIRFEDWLGFGIRNGWVSDQVCATHEGVPSTDEGRIEWDEGGDPCEVVIRVWPPEKWQEKRDAERQRVVDQ